MGFNPFKAGAKLAQQAIRVIAEPVKKVVNEVVDVGSDIGETVGNGVRRVAGPFIGMVDDLHNALMPRFRLDINANAQVAWPAQTDFNVNLKLPDFPGSSGAMQNFPALVGDLTGGFLSNITADRERLRFAKRRLQLLKHIALKGHRFGAEDTYTLMVSYTPDEPWKFAEKADETDVLGYFPVFEIKVREPAGSEQVIMLRISESAHRRFSEFRTQIMGRTGLDEPTARKTYSPALAKEAPSATESISLLRLLNNAGNNTIDINLATVGDRKIHRDAAGTLSVSLIRQSAYVRDSVFFAELKVKPNASFGTRKISANVCLSDEFRRASNVGFTMSKNLTGGIMALIDEGIDTAAPLKLEEMPAGAKWQDRAYEVNMRLAEKTETIAGILDDLKEHLRDLGSEDAFDIRGKAIGCFFPQNPTMQCHEVEIKLDTGASLPLLAISRLNYGEHITFMTPISSTHSGASELKSEWTAQKDGGTLAPSDAGSYTAQLDLAYGWLESLDTCYSVNRILSAPEAGQPAGAKLSHVISFACKNHFAQ
ncbi:MAG: hypothetical protein ABL974_06830 [Prosthecobacter sp.]